MTRSIRSSLISMSMIVSALASTLTACSAASYATTAYTYGNAAPAVQALIAGIEQAGIAPIPKVAYETGSGTITITFISYSLSGNS